MKKRAQEGLRQPPESDVESQGLGEPGQPGALEGWWPPPHPFSTLSSWTPGVKPGRGEEEEGQGLVPWLAPLCSGEGLASENVRGVLGVSHPNPVPL